MSATKIGRTDLFVTETSYRVNKEGLVNYTEVSKIAYPSNVATPAIGATKSIGAISLKAVSVNVASSGSEHTQYTVNYQGYGNTRTLQKDATYSTGEEPIATNENFNVSVDQSPSIVTLAGGRATIGLDGIVSGTGGALFDVNGGFLYFRNTAQYNFFGVSSYLQPNFEYRRQFTSQTRPSLGAVGRIVNAAADFPQIGGAGSRNWLCTGISYTARGSSYDVVHQFKASGYHGWNVYIYGASIEAPSIN
jgi:hypothetical protein